MGEGVSVGHLDLRIARDSTMISHETNYSRRLVGNLFMSDLVVSFNKEPSSDNTHGNRDYHVIMSVSGTDMFMGEL